MFWSCLLYTSLGCSPEPDLSRNSWRAKLFTIDERKHARWSENYYNFISLPISSKYKHFTMFYYLSLTVVSNVILYLTHILKTYVDEIGQKNNEVYSLYRNGLYWISDRGVTNAWSSYHTRTHKDTKISHPLQYIMLRKLVSSKH